MHHKTTRRTFTKALGAAGLVALADCALADGPRPIRYSAFIMDTHVHFGADGPGAARAVTPRADQLSAIYGPWAQIYDAHGKRIPRPVLYFDTIRDSGKLIKFMDDTGIDVSVIFPFDPNRVAKNEREVRADSTNDVIAEAVHRYPQRLVGMCGNDPFRSLWEAPLELKRRVEKDGFKGMKLYPPYYQFDPANRDLDPLYKMASDIGAIMIFHTGWTPLARAPMKYGAPQSLDDVALRFPDLRINMAHAGGPALWEEAVLVAARHRNMTLDVSSWCGYPPSLLVQLLDTARDLVGLDRVLYGSEHTLCPPTELIGLLLNINEFADRQKVRRFTREEIDQMLGANAARMFGVPPIKRT